jgi:hypothetical protein
LSISAMPRLTRLLPVVEMMSFKILLVLIQRAWTKKSLIALKPRQYR